MPELSVILQGVIVAAVLWVGKTSLDHSKALVRIETLLTGANQENGLIGDMKHLRAWKHEAANDLLAVESLARRVETLEQQAEPS